MDKVFYNQMLVTFKDAQTKALDDLSTYAIEMNTVYQRELHQNINVVNFANNRLFMKEKVGNLGSGMLESEMFDDELSLSSIK